MVRNFGERRKKKNHKKSKCKGARGEKEVDEVPCQEVTIYVPPEQQEVEGKTRVQQDLRSSKLKNTYRSKRMERQRLKKDRKGEAWLEEEEDEDQDNLDFGGEYDEIIRTGPSRRETGHMASPSISFIDLDRGRGRTGYSGNSNFSRECSMFELFVMAVADSM